MILSTAVGLYISVKKINTTLPNAMTKYWKYEIKKDLFCQDNGDESDSHQLGVRQILNMGVFFPAKGKRRNFKLGTVGNSLFKKRTKNAVSVDRTRDLQIFSLTLSQLSYPRCWLIMGNLYIY
jgi:hypothetical protein